MALATARRACRSRCSSAAAVFAGARRRARARLAQPVVREVAQLLFDRREPFRDRLVTVVHRRTSISRTSIQVRRRAGRQGGGRRARRRRRCSMQPGLADTTTGSSVPAGGAQRVDLAVADAPGEVGLRHRVRAAGAAAQAVVVGLEQLVRVRPGRSRTAPCACCTWRRWHGSCTTTRVPVGRRSSRGCEREPLGEVADPRAERTRRRSCRAGRRSPSSPRRSPRCRRRRARRPASTRSRAGRACALRRRARVQMQRAAAVAAGGRPRHRAPVAPHHPRPRTGACRAATRPSRSR